MNHERSGRMSRSVSGQRSQHVAGVSGARGDGDAWLMTVRGARILIISPHMDDVVLSVGGLLRRLQGDSVITLLTMFGVSCWSLAYGRRPDLQAQVTAARRTEEHRYARTLGASCAIAELPDSSLRGYDDKTETGVVTDDRAFVSEVETVLRKSLAAARPDVVLAPAGIGAHVDHTIVRDLTARWVKESGFDRCLLYEDLPYAVFAGPRDRLIASRLHKIDVPICATIDRKIEDLRIYQSQLDERAEHMVALHAAALGRGEPMERLFVAAATSAKHPCWTQEGIELEHGAR